MMAGCLLARSRLLLPVAAVSRGEEQRREEEKSSREGETTGTEAARLGVTKDPVRMREVHEWLIRHGLERFTP